MTHRDRAGDASGQGAGRREAAGDAGHRRGFPTPAHSATAGSPARPERRLPKAFGRPIALRWGARLPMSRIAAPRAPSRKPWEAVTMGHYQRSLVLGYRPPAPASILPIDQRPVMNQQSIWSSHRGLIDPHSSNSGAIPEGYPVGEIS